MLTKDEITRMIEDFDESELHKIAEFMMFLKFRSKFHRPALNERNLECLYAEFAETDRLEANEGIEKLNSGHDHQRSPQTMKNGSPVFSQ